MRTAWVWVLIKYGAGPQERGGPGGHRVDRYAVLEVGRAKALGRVCGGGLGVAGRGRTGARKTRGRTGGII